jgi:hypothetical protein
VTRDDRRRRCGNVGIRRLLPDFQARREGGKTRSGSFPRFPRRGISTATLFLLQRGSWGEALARDGEGCDFQYEGESRIFPQEVKS